MLSPGCLIIIIIISSSSSSSSSTGGVRQRAGVVSRADLVHAERQVFVVDQSAVKDRLVSGST